jgi:transaldolase/glucose-6-phosphate isomerase
MTRLKDLLAHGQSVWLDNINREMLSSGELAKMIDAGLRGMTSNPSIFEKALSTGTAYDASLRRLFTGRKTIEDVFDALAVEDVREAANQFQAVYKESNGTDGFVSIEVSPLYAHDTERTLAEARRLWTLVDRPNIMVKIPATKEGLPAIQKALAEGIPINVTLIFSVERYHEVLEAHKRAMEIRVAEGLPPAVESVASFFVSRIDVAVDKLIQEKIQRSKSAAEKDQLLELLGKTAVANAKAAYLLYKKTFGSPTWDPLKKKGARPQRPLWASTGTKNPHYPDLMYVDALIGVNTVNTLPPATLEAFLDHGTVADTLESGVDKAREVLEQLKINKIDLRKITETLETEGVKLFVDAYDKLLSGLRSKKESMMVTGAKKQGGN